ncbi:hypothetical protein ACNOYE_31050 [Nannocystaceae bacterium ST9]
MAGGPRTIMLPWLLSLGLFDAVDLGVAVLLTVVVVEGRVARPRRHALRAARSREAGEIERELKRR